MKRPATSRNWSIPMRTSSGVRRSTTQLDGKIRVSVVATGIEADAAAAPEPARVFSFPAARKVEAVEPTPAPVFAQPEPVMEAVVEEEPLTLTAPEPMAEPEVVAEVAPEPEPEPVAEVAEIEEPAALSFEIPTYHDDSVLELQPQASAEDSSELVLDNGTTAEGPLELSAPADAAPEPEADAEQEGRRRWLVSETSGEPERPAPRVAQTGGTLFERMSNIARGAAKADQDGDADPLDIPRFLNRQNNQ